MREFLGIFRPSDGDGGRPDPACREIPPDFFTYSCGRCSNYELVRRDGFITEDGRVAIFQDRTPSCCGSPMIQIG